MYKFYLKICKLNEKVHTIFISSVTLMSYCDVTLNKHNAGQGSEFCVWFWSCKDSMSLAVSIQFLRLNVIYLLQSYVQRFVDVNVGGKNHDFNFPLILHKHNICAVMQKLKLINASIYFCYQCRVST